MPARCCFFTDRDARVTRWRNLEHRWCAQVWPGTLSLFFSFCFRSHLPSAEKGNLPSIRSNRRLLTAHREITTIHNKLRSDPKQVIQTKQGKNAQPFISMITRNTTWGPKSNLIHIQMRQSTCPIGVPPSPPWNFLSRPAVKSQALIWKKLPSSRCAPVLECVWGVVYVWHTHAHT